MVKRGDQQLASTPCSQCGAPSTIEVGGMLYCGAHTPQPGEKSAQESLPSLKDAAIELISMHSPFDS
jgi:hypothetical protein